jgi:hypothetical protein
MRSAALGYNAVTGVTITVRPPTSSVQLFLTVRRWLRS